MALKPRGAKGKGDNYERELATYFNESLFNGSNVIFRAPLSGGGRNLSGGGSADLTGTPHIWVEAKRTEKLRLYEALHQAEKGIREARSPDFPVVINRRSRMKTGESLTIMRLDDWLNMYRTALKIWLP
jgi:Holliday junction resolvase